MIQNFQVVPVTLQVLPTLRKNPDDFDISTQKVSATGNNARVSIGQNLDHESTYVPEALNFGHHSHIDITQLQNLGWWSNKKPEDYDLDIKGVSATGNKATIDIGQNRDHDSTYVKDALNYGYKSNINVSLLQNLEKTIINTGKITTTGGNNSIKINGDIVQTGNVTAAGNSTVDVKTPDEELKVSGLQTLWGWFTGKKDDGKTTVHTGKITTTGQNSAISIKGDVVQTGNVTAVGNSTVDVKTPTEELKVSQLILLI